jgi:hypothetical protein
VLVGLGTNWPAGQVEQPKAPAAEYLPLWQLMHVDAVALLYFPAAQFVHGELLAPVNTRSSGQLDNKQFGYLPALNLPAGQPEQYLLLGPHVPVIE